MFFIIFSYHVNEKPTEHLLCDDEAKRDGSQQEIYKGIIKNIDNRLQVTRII